MPPPAYGQATAYGGGGAAAAAAATAAGGAMGGGGGGSPMRAAAAAAPAKKLKWSRDEAKRFDELAELFAIIKVRVRARGR